MVDHSVISSVWQPIYFSWPQRAGMGKVASVCRPYPFSLVNIERSLVSFAVTLSLNSLFIEINACCLVIVSHSLKEEEKEEEVEVEEEEEEEKEEEIEEWFIYVQRGPRRDRTLL